MSTFYGDMYGERRKRFGLKLGGFLGVAAVIAGGCAAAYAFSDTVKNQVKLAFSSPQDYFTWVCEKNANELSESFAGSYQEMLDLSHSAMFAPRPEARNIKFFFRYRHSPCVAEFEIDGLPLVAEPRAVRLLTLQASLNLISLSVLYKSPSRSTEYKSHVIFLTIIVQVLYPFVVAGSCTAIIFSVTEHLLNLSCRKVFPNRNRPDKRCTHDSFMPER